MDRDFREKEEEKWVRDVFLFFFLKLGVIDVMV
jgi:hypothetical protein